MSTVPFYIQLLNWNLFEGSMQYFPPHLNFERLSEKLIPDKDFSGKIITDFGGNWTQDPELQDQHSNHWATQVVEDEREFCNTWKMSGTAWFLKRVNACIQLVHYLNLPHLNWNGLFPFTKKNVGKGGHWTLVYSFAVRRSTNWAIWNSHTRVNWWSCFKQKRDVQYLCREEIK